MSLAAPMNRGLVNADHADVYEEIERLAEEIRNKVNGTHLNVRVVWFETLLPIIEETRVTARASTPARRLAAEHVLAALRDFADSL